MAVKVSDIYNIVCSVLLENYDNGAAPGLSLGIVTLQDFLDLFGIVVEEFINRTSLSYSIFTQQLGANQSLYQFPTNINTPKLCFIGGQWIDHTDLDTLDDWRYAWANTQGTPEYWYSDGLSPHIIGVAPNPDYSGASYTIPVGPTPIPPFGITNLFNGATQGQFNSTISVTGVTATWVSGDLFDVAWGNYSPGPTMMLGLASPIVNGTPAPIQTVASSTSLTFAIAPGDGVYFAQVNIGNDGNLSIIGTTGLTTITYGLNDTVPVLPDSFCGALAYGILARIFSNDSECKDLQRAYYCQARYSEYINVAAAISGELLEISG